MDDIIFRGHITEPANTTAILKTHIKNLMICKNTVSLIEILQLSVLQLRNQSLKQICYWLWKYKENYLLPSVLMMMSENL